MGKIRQKHIYYWCHYCKGRRIVYAHFKSDLINHLRKRHGIVATKKIIEQSQTPRIVKEE